MPLPLFHGLKVPVVAAPMLLISGPDLVIAQCRAGIVGTFPALNARSSEELGEWCDQIARAVPQGAAWGVNLIVAPSNTRLLADLAICVAHKVPLVITSLRSPADLAREITGYGGVHLHDVTTLRHAENALSSGCSGLVLVCAGAGGHGGTLSPMSFADEVRRLFDGPMLIGGGIGTGAGVLASQVMGAGAAYIGTRFIAARESLASKAHRRMVIAAKSADIIYTPMFSGIAANYLRASLTEAGLDPAHMPSGAKRPAGMSPPPGLRAWVDILGAGHGAAAIDREETTAEIVEALASEYTKATTRMAASEC